MKLLEVRLTALIWVVLGPALGGQTMTKHSRYSEYILSSDINIATRTTHSVFVYADRRQPRLGSRLWWLEAQQTNTNYLLDENTHHHNTQHAHPQHCCPLHQVSGTWSQELQTKGIRRYAKISQSLLGPSPWFSRTFGYPSFEALMVTWRHARKGQIFEMP